MHRKSKIFSALLSPINTQLTHESDTGLKLYQMYNTTRNNITNSIQKYYESHKPEWIPRHVFANNEVLNRKKGKNDLQKY